MLPRGGLAAALALTLAAALAPPASAAALPPDFFGVYSEDVFEARGEARAATFQSQRDTGLGIVRLPLDWSTIQPDPDRWNWTVHDQFVLDAARAGMRILPFLVQTPGWAREPANAEAKGIWPPQFPDYIVEFAVEATRRYGPGGSLWRAHPGAPYLPIRSWQIWNEPNLWAFWRTGPDAAEYAALLRSAARAIRSVDPAAEIVSAGLAANREEPHDRFLSRIYDAGAAGAMDTVAVHPYAGTPAQTVENVEEIVAVVAARGGSEPLWATEFGWATVGTYGWVTDETGQAEWLSEAVSRLTRERDRLRLRGVATYSWRDSKGDAWTANAGVRRLDNSPKPALFALRETIRAFSPPETREAVPAGFDGAVPDVPPAARSGASGASGGTWSLRIFGRKRLRATRDGRVALDVRCGSTAVAFCLGSVWLERAGSRGLGSTRFRVGPGKTNRVRVRLNAAARRLLRRSRRVRLVVRAAATDIYAHDAESRLRRTLTVGAFR